MNHEIEQAASNARCTPHTAIDYSTVEGDGGNYTYLHMARMFAFTRLEREQKDGGMTSNLVYGHRMHLQAMPSFCAGLVAHSPRNESYRYMLDEQYRRVGDVGWSDRRGPFGSSAPYWDDPDPAQSMHKVLDRILPDVDHAAVRAALPNMVTQAAYRMNRYTLTTFGPTMEAADEYDMEIHGFMENLLDVRFRMTNAAFHVIPQPPNRDRVYAINSALAALDVDAPSVGLLIPTWWDISASPPAFNYNSDREVCTYTSQRIISRDFERDDSLLDETRGTGGYPGSGSARTHRDIAESIYAWVDGLDGVEWTESSERVAEYYSKLHTGSSGVVGSNHMEYFTSWSSLGGALDRNTGRVVPLHPQLSTLQCNSAVWAALMPLLAPNSCWDNG